MSALKDQLHSDLTTSMKARDALRTSTLRMVLTAITNAEVSGKEVRELSDEDVITVLGAEAKKRREAAQAFADGDRPELAEKETAEAAILAEYLPAQLSTEEIAVIVTAAV
ncbi:MAG: GatB/YqeY domain-containing protein, partial [Aeromicrobium sp.]